MRAYRKNYLNNAAENFGTMMDYAVNDCSFDGDRFLHMFIASGLAHHYETGSFKVIAKMSGIEMAAEAIRLATGKQPAVIPAQPGCRTAEHWAGWALAHYQWYTARTFSSIILRLPYSNITALYHSLHGKDIAEFYKTADGIIARSYSQTNLERIRDTRAMPQPKLARVAGVPLRMIQLYEKRDKDINKAQAITLSKISRALGCTIEDLLEDRN